MDNTNSQSPTPTPITTLDPKLFAYNPPCGSAGDCGSIGIYGNNVTCNKKGNCQNCQDDFDCNGVTTPLGKCVNNVCSCLSNSDCSCEGNDPYGCGYDKKGNCTCSKEHKALAAIKITPEKAKSMFLILGVGLLGIIGWSTYIIKFSNFEEVKANKYLTYGSIGIFILSCIIVIATGSK
jgi:hypothetical protein